MHILNLKIYNHYDIIKNSTVHRYNKGTNTQILKETHKEKPQSWKLWGF